jgi:hypothetical protein
MSESVRETVPKLSAKQNKALEALLSGAAKGDAATVAGVTPRTLNRWINEDVLFWDTLQGESQKTVYEATRRLTAAMDTAVTVINEVMIDKATPAAIRLRAAQIVADTALKLIETSDILRRLDELETKVIGNEGRHRYATG